MLHLNAHQSAVPRGERDGALRKLGESVLLAIVHHANQYIITNGYENRSGLDESADGYLKVLELHRDHRIPFNLHVSGTLLECLSWYRSDVLSVLKEMHQDGLVEFIGSSYGQNIMRFFSQDHNLKQLDEQLSLYRDLLDVDPRAVRVFWPPERVWDTRQLAPVLTNSALLNGGYSYVLLDDRTLYRTNDSVSSRREFDESDGLAVNGYTACRIQCGKDLIALPISRILRWNIPPQDESSFERLNELLDELEKQTQPTESTIAIFADDMEKTAGFGGWDPRGPKRFEAFLQWLNESKAFQPAQLSKWASRQQFATERPIDVGTFVELSDHFGAGEGYENWYLDPQWSTYRSYYDDAERIVKQQAANGADAKLIQLAWKVLLVSCWETAWHTPSCGVHGDPDNNGEPSPWSKAVASHVRHAMVIAEAAHWMTHQDGAAHACLSDIDHDGEDELVLKNDKLFAVFTLRWGARLTYLFNVEANSGKMVIGNPCDDWNWQEELNKYMQIPANHPGALTDLRFEDDRYEVNLHSTDGDEVKVQFVNSEPRSAARGMQKFASLAAGSNEIKVEYSVPDEVAELSIECGMSPDYYALLRGGPDGAKPIRGEGTWGYRNGNVSAWIRVDESAGHMVEASEEREFGHGWAVRMRAPSKVFTMYVGSRVSNAEADQLEIGNESRSDTTGLTLK